MLTIKKFGNKTAISCTTLTDDYEKSVLKFAVTNYSFVNGIVNYSIDGKKWIENIRSVYNENELRTKEVIKVLENITLR